MGGQAGHWEDGQIDLVVKQRGSPLDGLTDRWTANLAHEKPDNQQAA